MLYKDITQWLRNRTFVALFFGLLIVAEAISLFILSLSEDITKPGPVVFYSLYFVLIVYGLVVALMGHGLTAREFANRTFELYELSGMSLERMISGKLLSMIYQFMFGFFCIIPFMFFAYFIGGLDFFDILSGMAITLLFILPFYLVTLLVALSSRLKQVSTLGRIGAIFGLIFFVLSGFMSLVAPTSPLAELFRAITRLMKEVLEGNTMAMLGIVAFLVFYSQLCLLLFYLCCNTISRETDSRELQIKLLCTTLVTSWLILLLCLILIHGYDKDSQWMGIVPVFILLCILGVTLFYNRIEVPVIVRNRYRGANRRRRWLYFLFMPGAWGTYRTTLLILAITTALTASYFVVGFGIYSASLPPGRTSGDPLMDWFQAISIPVQLPFFLMFPTGLFLGLKELKKNYPVQRTMTAIWWGVAGAVSAFVAAWSDQHHYATTPVFHFITLIVSPFSSAFAEVQNSTVIYEMAPYIRILMGAIGVVIMRRHLGRRQLESTMTAVVSAPATPPPTAEPLESVPAAS